MPNPGLLSLDDTPADEGDPIFAMADLIGITTPAAKAAQERSPRRNGGTALVIHAKADDMKTDPPGNAGDRIAGG